jgi:hypothetical protein
VAPVAFAVVFELVRLGTDGPLVDAPQFSTYVILAFIVGRGEHGLVSLIPMALGAIFGAAGARMMTTTDSSGRPSSQGRIGLNVHRGGTVVASLAGLALIAGLARPASTAGITDADGNEIAGSIAEFTTVEVNGHD